MRADASDQGHALVIENGTSSPIGARREIRVERSASGAWQDIGVGLLYLRERCESAGGGLVEPSACVAIAPGATFRAAAWTHMTGDAQCACEECGPAGAGSYRFVVTACEGGASFETAAFEVH